jgi:hypothetical protein
MSFQQFMDGFLQAAIYQAWKRNAWAPPPKNDPFARVKIQLLAIRALNMSRHLGIRHN